MLGFGHPFLGAGRSRFLLGDGYVYQTIAAPIAGTSYKLGRARDAPGHDRRRPRRRDHRPPRARRGHHGGEPRRPTPPAAPRARSARRSRRTSAPRRIAGGLVQDEPAVRVRDGLGGGTLTLSISITQPRPEDADRLPQRLRGRRRRRVAGQRPAAADHGHADAERRAPGADLLDLGHPAARARGPRRAHRRGVDPPAPRPGRAAARPWSCGSSPTARRPASCGSPCGCPRTSSAGARGIVRGSRSRPTASTPVPADLSPGPRRLGRSSRRRAAAVTAAPSASPSAPPAPASRGSSPACAGPPTTATTRCACSGRATTPTIPRAGVTVPVPYVIYGGRADRPA